MKHLTEAMESLQVVFFSMVARTFPASSLNSSTAPMALPLSSNAYQLYLSYYILFDIYLLFYQKFLIWAAFHLLLHAKVISLNERSLLLYNCCNFYYLIYGTHKSLCSPKCCCPQTKCGFSAAWALLFWARCRSPASPDLISASEDCCGLDVSCSVV